MTALEDLRPGDETASYEVTGHPIREPGGGVRIPVRDFADPWRESFVTGAPREDVVVIHRGPAS